MEEHTRRSERTFRHEGLKRVFSDEVGKKNKIHFRHQDWKRESEFTAHCSMKWATFLLSLKNLIEVGEGRPAPDDLKIDDMN